MIAASTLWSLAAQVVPAVVGVVAIPFIVHGLGVERFGILTIAWMVIGYFGLFDLGLGRAVTKFAAELLAADDRVRFRSLVWTAWYVMLALGLVGTVILASITPWLTERAIKIPLELRAETRAAFYLLALCIPVVVLTTGFRGLLEAQQQFKQASLVRIPLGALTFLVPLVMLPFTTDLSAIVLALVVVRVAGAVAYFGLCWGTALDRRPAARFDRPAAGKLVRFGAWLTVSNVVSPLMVTVDRFFVGAFLSVAAVAYYATPFEAVTKLLIIPSAIAAVLFPAFSTAAAIDRARLVALFRHGVTAVFLIMYPIVCIVITFAPELLKLWLGETFATQSAGVWRWLAFGVLTNSLAAVPYALLQGVGRSDVTAKLHVAEAPFYLALLFLLIHSDGIIGAAIAWSARTTVDMALLYWFAAPHLRAAGPASYQGAGAMTALLPVAGIGFVLRTPLEKAFVTAALSVVFVWLTWRWLQLRERLRAETTD